jgi:hypothetical protein
VRFPRASVALRIAAVCALLALALMLWSLLDPTVLPVMVSMTAGQALGSVALGLYVVVLIADARRKRLLRVLMESRADSEGEESDEARKPAAATGAGEADAGGDAADEDAGAGEARG